MSERTNESPSAVVTDPSGDPRGAIGDQHGAGDPLVEEVLGTLDGLDDLGVEEHLPVFEQAQEALRRALDRPAEAGSGS